MCCPALPLLLGIEMGLTLSFVRSSHVQPRLMRLLPWHVQPPTYRGLGSNG